MLRQQKLTAEFTTRLHLASREVETGESGGSLAPQSSPKVDSRPHERPQQKTKVQRGMDLWP